MWPPSRPPTSPRLSPGRARQRAPCDYKQTSVRALLGKIALLFEEELYPGFSLLLAGEINHLKATSRFGLAINIEN